MERGSRTSEPAIRDIEDGILSPVCEATARKTGDLQKEFRSARVHGGEAARIFPA